MKNFLSLALCFGALSLVGLSGCGEEAKTESTTKVETPTGSETKTVVEKDKTTGDMAPPKAP